MSKFYFDISDGDRKTIDDTGQLLESISDARGTAIRELSLLMRDQLPDGDRAGYIVTVRDAEGKPIMVATAMMLFEPIG